MAKMSVLIMVLQETPDLPIQGPIRDKEEIMKITITIVDDRDREAQ